MIGKLIKLVIVGVVVIGVAVFARTEILHFIDHKVVAETKNFKVPTYVSSSNGSSASTSSKPNACASNSLSQLVLVSISQRHLWACNGSTVAYSSAVITGIDYLAADLTPTGTYHIYAKETNVNLVGHDSTGSWNDHVSYWMPFLYNQYGAYGIHDATWRNPNQFGSISPSSSQGSHGCVEAPLATAAWVYNWSKIGTTVTIEN